jgi:hypothetical protein
MSLKNFIPEIWSARILGYLAKAQVLAGIANRDYQGEITGFGDTVKINAIGDITVAAYTRATTITPQALSDQQTKLLIDQSNYFAFSIDDLDKAQQNPKVMSAAIEKSAYTLKDTADAYLAGLWAQAGTKVTQEDVAASNVIDWLIAIGLALDENDVPTNGRWIILPPSLSAKVVKAKILTDTNNSEVLANGGIGRACGFDIKMSNNLKVVTTYTKVLAGTNAGLSYAEQIVEVEGYRPQSSFSDAVKGLHVFGAKVVQADCFCCAPAKAVAEE